ncbi:ABC transporter permease [Pannonibacter phragmitetus]|uniref:Phosphate transport system permease protein n=1 Tax=Pannonibacter phragmitetus TaxID=121719 RepID=A0A0L0J5U1_9HYPH|nr:MULTISPECIES: phosphate ABC transporter permease subunit PstC [Pannonibacter]ALV25747.1 ABC transporter permease [Pannonibacter phragmitetus]KND20958.1 ABC transporter permease [Pannonibacter phragmitetus]MBA4205388.1 phosphate ABC transporter permease subunit PstC [Polymorphum sp.]
MSLGALLLIIVALAFVGAFAGRSRAVALVGGDRRKLHSLPGHYGTVVFLFTAVPALVLMAAWLFLSPVIIEGAASRSLPEASSDSSTAMTLVMTDVRRIAGGLQVLARRGDLSEESIAEMRGDLSLIRGRMAQAGVALGADVRSEVFEAAKSYRAMTNSSRFMMAIAVIAVAAAGLVWSFFRINPDFRARNVSEQFTRSMLLAASLVAVLTTFGIVSSLLFETYNFFNMYPATEFFFGTVWNPQFRGGSELGILPLLWGTLYVSTVALLFAVPVGLYAAIYMSEYASKPVRSIAKPLLELLAGIPTIVYGLFALITVGPFLRDYFAQPMGLGNSSSSVLTAGLVMGIMLIPFVSSLSDDIINAVPQSLRDGAYGLGATRSEAIRQVVFPAALPGIVGAVLLAASRAIGETMIVVMGAGAAAKLGLNPFDAMTTVTVKIVSQLTGDTEFASPETLVAFALGMTLFVFTLGLNVAALYIVRKYREQYE